MAISLAQAKKLRPGRIMYAIGQYNADGTAMRAKVNGKVQTWKTRPDEVKIPYKRGMYEYGYVTERDLRNFTLKEPAARKPKSRLVRKGDLGR